MRLSCLPVHRLVEVGSVSPWIQFALPQYRDELLTSMSSRHSPCPSCSASGVHTHLPMADY